MSAAAQPQNPARTFRHLMKAVETLSPRHLEELVSRALSTRSRKEAHADIEHYSGPGCPHCGGGTMQKWGTNLPASSASAVQPAEGRAQP